MNGAPHHSAFGFRHDGGRVVDKPDKFRVVEQLAVGHKHLLGPASFGDQTVQLGGGRHGSDEHLRGHPCRHAVHAIARCFAANGESVELGNVLAGFNSRVAC